MNEESVKYSSQVRAFALMMRLFGILNYYTAENAQKTRHFGISQLKNVKNALKTLAGAKI